MMYELALKLVKTVEAELVGGPPSVFAPFDFLKRHTVYPLKLLMKGFGIWSADFTKFSIFYSLLALYGSQNTC